LLLKTISLAGFKSFADRTRLEFDAGVNVVVGPNGSGKSNILDALAWAMGTQATRQLRTERMDDVIFAGTATRPKVARAEVTVTFDNRDGFLPLDLTEVALTRRLFRDGTSEYELNGTQCRLLDLQELLSDGGVGRHQHVLVGQGQIGEILNARPDEQRAVIEEAAGITKHRSRRDRSVRRLEQTAQDVERLVDILDQSKKRLGPLRRQANAAQRHDSVKAEVLALQLYTGGEALRRIRARIEVAAAEHAERRRGVSTDEQALAEVESTLDSLRSSAGAVGLELERATAAAARLETTAERLQRIGMVARERRSGLESRLAGAGERRRDLEVEYAALGAELDRSGADEHEARASAERTEAMLQQLEDEERALAEQIQLPAEGLVASMRGELRSLESAWERDRREQEQLAHRRQVVQARLGDERGRSAGLDDVIRRTDAEAAKAGDAYETARSRRAEAQRGFESIESANSEAQLALARSTARLEAVEAVLEGLGDPSARQAAAALAAIRGTVAALLDVPASMAAAVDAALGDWRSAFAAQGPSELRSAVEQLKSAGLGGVAFVDPAPVGDDPPARAVAQEWGVDALVDLLGPSADHQAANALLGDVVVVEGWTAGSDLVARHPEVRAVTPEGDYITELGMRLALPDGAGPAALEAAAVAVEIAEREAARAASLQASSRREFDQARAREREALEALEALEARLAGNTEALAISERACTEAEAEIARNESRRTAIDEAAEARQERAGELRARLAELEGEERVRQEAFEALSRRRVEVARRRDEARRAREAAAGALARVLERREMLQRRHSAVQADLEHIETAPTAPADVARLAGVEERARSAVEIVREHIAELRRRQRDLRERSTAADARLDGARQRQDALARGIADAKEALSTLAVELAELRVRDESVCEALRRDADATEEQALAAARPDVDEDAPDLKDLLATREAELRRMGPINPLAAAEYEEVASEAELLETQLADLEESRTELRKVIRALDEEMASMFMVAFEQIAALYEENFGLVFPGGRGSLRLTDPGRPLETGVEIEAQPLGKKVGRLSLLSGGERSLAALAFLFAVFRARPSPFYVLDEVEAALDDANLRRFLRLVDTLRNSAQLVIITHQQQTMEAADILYGVTMEPGESSKVIAKRLGGRRGALESRTAGAADAG
jgi:chromosome segregation protein